MLFYYLNDTADVHNWLHLWFMNSVELCLDAIDGGLALPTWHQLTTHREKELRGRPALKRDFFAFTTAYADSGQSERSTIRAAILQQDRVADACSTGSCLRASDLPIDVAAAAIALGERVFNLLSELEIRKLHYEDLWNALDANVCPFCALADLDHPSLPSEDLDHYLTRKIYPFAAADLRNLAPMCSRCNMDYKKDKDVLSVAGVERHYPYAATSPGQVTLSGSEFFRNGDDKPPRWRVSLLPTAKEAEWDRIFGIKSRYQLTILDRRYMAWLEEWASNLHSDFNSGDEEIIASLQEWSIIWAARGLNEKAFLKAAYLKMVYECLQAGGGASAQLFAVIRSQISMFSSAAASKAA